MSPGRDVSLPSYRFARDSPDDAPQTRAKGGAKVASIGSMRTTTVPAAVVGAGQMPKESKPTGSGLAAECQPFSVGPGLFELLVARGGQDPVPPARGLRARLKALQLTVDLHSGKPAARRGRR